MDGDSFEASGFVVVEVEMLLEPREDEFYDGAFPVDVFQVLGSVSFEIFCYSENVAFACSLVCWEWYRGFDSVVFSCLSEIVAGVLAVSSQLTYRSLCDLGGGLEERYA